MPVGTKSSHYECSMRSGLIRLRKLVFWSTGAGRSVPQLPPRASAAIQRAALESCPRAFGAFDGQGSRRSLRLPMLPEGPVYGFANRSAVYRSHRSSVCRDSLRRSCRRVDSANRICCSAICSSTIVTTCRSGSTWIREMTGAIAMTLPRFGLKVVGRIWPESAHRSRASHSLDPAPTGWATLAVTMFTNFS